MGLLISAIFGDGEKKNIVYKTEGKRDWREADYETLDEMWAALKNWYFGWESSYSGHSRFKYNLNMVHKVLREFVKNHPEYKSDLPEMIDPKKSTCTAFGTVFKIEEE